MLPELERSSPTPLYQQIQDWMRGQIAHGIWPEHYKLKSETDLAAELGVNRGTIRTAITKLIEEALLVRIHGRGTFVRAHSIEQPLADHFITFSEGLVMENISFETQVLEQAQMVPTQRIASLLSIPSGATVLYLKRVRCVHSEPLLLLKNYIVCDFCPGIAALDFRTTTLFNTLEKTYGLKIDWGRRLFEARAAGPEVASTLALDPAAPVMYLQQLSYLENGAPIELSDLWIRGDHYRISAIVKRHGKQTRVSSRQEFR